MKYKELNDLQRMKMKSFINTSLNFDWDDNELIDELIGIFPNIANYDVRECPDDKELHELLHEINIVINSFNEKKINAELFLQELEPLLEKLTCQYNNFKYLYKANIDWYKQRITRYKKLLISGVGGIGKSHFIYTLESKLNELNINTLCIYGKFTDNFNNSYIDEILSESEHGEFVFIIDAFNELNKNIQTKILSNIDRIIESKNIRLIITYRTNSIPRSVINLLERKFNSSYIFEGVSYESAVINLIEIYGLNISKFEEILETKNPLYLKMLFKILNNRKLTKELINSNSQITFILEQYIKDTINLEIWEQTKILCKYMYQNSRKYITDKELTAILGMQKYKNYLTNMIQNGFLINSYGSDEQHYYFTMETLCDYLIARNLNDDIKNLNTNDLINVINSKLEHLYSLGEAFILILFDRYCENVKLAIDIIKKSDLKEYLELNIFKRIKFNKSQILIVQENLNITPSISNLFIIGGYENKPFNCMNYFNDVLKKDNSIILEFNKSELSNYHSNAPLRKIKNAIYYLLNSKSNNTYIEEIFWLSAWCTISPNDDLKNMAMKYLYMTCSKFPEYIEKLKSLYLIDEEYLKNAIVYVLANLRLELRLNNKDFFESIINDYNEINSFRIYFANSGISENKYKYIDFNKRNIFNETKNVKPNNMINDFIREIDIHNKDLLCFNSYSKNNELEMNDKFILGSKKKIQKWNKQITEIFKCVEDGECCGYMPSIEFIKELYPLKANLNVISNRKLYICFQIILEELLQKYQYNYKKWNDRFDEHFNSFNDSQLRKIALIAEQRFLGSLMCNYFTDDFETFNGFERKVGYSVYNPYEYGLEFNIHSPISLYNEDVDRLNQKLVSNLNILNRNESWWNDDNNAKENFLNVIKPIKFKGYEWLSLGAVIHFRTRDSKKAHELVNSETYDIYSACNVESHVTGSHDRYLTIENPEYKGNIEDYIYSNNNHCNDVSSVQYHSNHYNETYLLLPPAPIINVNKLSYKEVDSTWRDKNNNIIIYCNNNNCKFYDEIISSSIFIRKDIYDKTIEKLNIKYFGYTERYLQGKGYNDDKTSIHAEFDKFGIINFSHNKNQSTNKEKEEKCKNCIFGIYPKIEALLNGHENLLLNIINDLPRDDSDL